MGSSGRWSEPGSDLREGIAPGRGKRTLVEHLDRHRTTPELTCEDPTGAEGVPPPLLPWATALAPVPTGRHPCAPTGRATS